MSLLVSQVRSGAAPAPPPLLSAEFGFCVLCSLPSLLVLVGVPFTRLLVCLPCCSVDASRGPRPALSVSPGPSPVPGWHLGRGVPWEGMKPGACEHVGKSSRQGRGAGTMPAHHPSPSLRPDTPLPRVCEDSVLVTTRMAAQGMGPGELVPQMAQMLYVPALVKGVASPVPPTACQGCV